MVDTLFLRTTIITEPGTVPLVGMEDAWHWALAPGFDFSAALSADKQLLLQSYALNSYDEVLITDMLTFARRHSAQLHAVLDRPLTLLAGFSSAGYRFDSLVILGPMVHKYQADLAAVHDKTLAVQPAYRCEFAGDEDQKDAVYRYSRAAGVPTTRLDRTPSPFLKVRMVTESGREIMKRGFTSPEVFIHDLQVLEGSDRFVEFETYRHDVFRVEWRNGWQVDGGKPQDFDSLLAFVHKKLYGPNA